MTGLPGNAKGDGEVSLMGSLDEFSRQQVILSALRTTGRVAVGDSAHGSVSPR